MRMRTFVTNQRGMTLMEVMFAVAIIGIGLAALLSAIPIAAYGIQEGNQLSTATFLANQRMEQVRNATWQAASPPPVQPAVLLVDKLGASAPITTAPVGDGGAITFPDENLGPSPPCTFAPLSGSGCYTRNVRITDCGVAPGCNGIVAASLRQVTVTVSYRPMTGIGVASAGTSKAAVITMLVTQR